MGLIIHPNMTRKDLDYRIRCHFWRVNNINHKVSFQKCENSTQRFLFLAFKTPPPSSTKMQGAAPPRRLISQQGTTCFSIRHFIWLWRSGLFALLHPDSIRNGLMPPFRDWRLFCHWALCSASWLMGSPGGLSEVSLKNKVWKSERSMCLQMCIGKWMWCTFLKCLVCSKSKF